MAGAGVGGEGGGAFSFFMRRVGEGVFFCVLWGVDG